MNEPNGHIGKEDIEKLETRKHELTVVWKMEGKRLQSEPHKVFPLWGEGQQYWQWEIFKSCAKSEQNN